MILCDTGPLIALINRNDQFHQLCVDTLPLVLSQPLLTTWQCMAETMYFLGKVGGNNAQDILWEYIDDQLVIIHQPGKEEWKEIRNVMKQYKDIPMDIADASLVVAAQHHGIRKIFTLDSHFLAYKIFNKYVFDVIPLKT